jgi:hypothetical protein
MSTWVNAADHDCTLAYVPMLSYVVVETKKVGHFAQGLQHWIRAASLASVRLMRTGNLALNLGGPIQHREKGNSVVNTPTNSVGPSKSSTEHPRRRRWNAVQSPIKRKRDAHIVRPHQTWKCRGT